MPRSRFVVACAGLVSCLAVGLIQPVSFAAGQAPPTFEQALAGYGVPLTRPALLQALKDRRPEVRGLAASELAQMRDTQAVPEIREALASETSEQERLALASALLTLGDSDGEKYLAKACSSSEESWFDRMYAASQLLRARKLCVASVLKIDPGDAVNETMTMLYYLKQANAIRPVLDSEVHRALIGALRSTSAFDRGLAAQCAAELGDKAAVPDLRRALKAESDPLAKAAIQQSVAKLEGYPVAK